jgi:2-keto-3-deoxy-L-rhamnonate aldolase RhmA
VNTAAQAAAVVAAARYGPEGHRGAANGRAHDYGVHKSRIESSAWINENVLVIPMVEEVEAVANLEAIANTSGVDVLHVASSDLGQSMGNPPQAEVRAHMAQIVPRIRAVGKHAGIGGNAVSDTAGIAALVDAGANFVTISALALMRTSAEAFRDAVLGARRIRPD